MRALIQRVKKSCVSVDGNLISQIGHGMNIMLGVFEDDTPEDLEYLVKKGTVFKNFFRCRRKDKFINKGY